MTTRVQPRSLGRRDPVQERDEARRETDEGGGGRADLLGAVRRELFRPRTLLAVVIASVLLIVLARGAMGVDLTETWLDLRGARPGLLLLGLGAFYLSFLLRTARWQVILGNVGLTRAGGYPMPSFVRLARIVLIAAFANAVSVARLGDVYRAFALRREARVALPVALGTIVAERILDVVALVALVVAAMVAGLSGDLPRQVEDVAVAGFILATGGGGFLVIVRKLRPFATRVIPVRWCAYYAQLEAGTSGALARVPLLLAYSTLAWLSEGATLFLLARAVAAPVSAAGALLAGLVASLLSVEPLTPGGLGATETGILIVLRSLGVAPDAAAAVAALNRLVNYLSLAVVGPLLFAVPLGIRALSAWRRARPASGAPRGVARAIAARLEPRIEGGQHSMADNETTIGESERGSWSASAASLGGRDDFRGWYRLALGGEILLSIFMNFFQLGQYGFDNLFYAAGVRSMLDSWHNFFFASYDPGGFVTLDKPPVGFWLQVASARLLGFTPFSVLLPQALAGVLAVLLLYDLVRRRFGIEAGLLAALALAVSPITVVTNRNNTIDSTLALVLLIGAWAVLRATETGKLRYVLLAAALVGIGFNVKMLEAYLVVPAFGLLYLLASPRSWRTRIGHLALGGVVLLAVSFSWAMAVDLTPASQRPYVGSTQDNSELSLALGYNGIDRLLGMFARRRTSLNRVSLPDQSFEVTANAGSPLGPGAIGAPENRTQPAEPSFANRGVGGGLFGAGAPGPLRLFAEPLGGQIAWLLPLALLAMVAAGRRRPAWQRDRQQQSLILWGAWLLTMAVFFSVAGFIHPYYLTEMAPAIAALAGIGIVTMWRDYRRADWRGWLLPIALIATLAEQVYLLRADPSWGSRLIPVIGILGGFGLVWLVGARIFSGLDASLHRLRLHLGSVAVGVTALLVAPSVWAVIPVVRTGAAPMPVAGPALVGTRDFEGGEGSAQPSRALERFLEANQGTTKFLLATPSSMSADAFILATDQPVMAIGGFAGSDPILTPGALATLVANNTVRFVLLNAPRDGQPRVTGFGTGLGSQTAITAWVKQNCAIVPATSWGDSTANPGKRSMVTSTSLLYDCEAASASTRTSSSSRIRSSGTFAAATSQDLPSPASSP